MTDPLNPLSEADYDKIVKGIQQAETAIAAADKAATAGINLDQARNTAIESRDRLLRLKNVYFPGR